MQPEILSFADIGERVEIVDRTSFDGPGVPHDTERMIARIAIPRDGLFQCGNVDPELAIDGKEQFTPGLRAIRIMLGDYAASCKGPRKRQTSTRLWPRQLGGPKYAR